MNIVIIRHAHAVDRTADVAEEHRYLTPEGRSFFRKTADTMKKKGICPDIILTSPLLRSVQTADILAETISFSGPVIATDKLAPGCNTDGFWDVVSTSAECRELVIVGHEPDLGEIIASLFSLQERIGLKKGTAMKLKLNEVDPHDPPVFKWLAAGGKLIKSQDDIFA